MKTIYLSKKRLLNILLPDIYTTPEMLYLDLNISFLNLYCVNKNHVFNLKTSIFTYLKKN